MTDLARLTTALADRYAIERELGSGGMATVYRAQDVKHGRKVAVKVMHPGLAATIGADRFLREIQVAAALSHPRILSLYDSGEASGFLYYVMPYVEGESLRDRLNREGQLPLEEAVQISRDVAAALSYAPGNDVIHRDIKPENILLSGGEAVVADFGIARAISEAGGERLTETGLAVGTPAYMSPEQATGERLVDGRSDIYSLGSVLYEMLAGEPPYTGPTAQAIMARKLSEPVPALQSVRDTVPQPIEYVVRKALARVPADRFQTAAQFGETLGRAITPGADLVATAISREVPVSRAARWTRPLPWAVAGCGPTPARARYGRCRPVGAGNQCGLPMGGRSTIGGLLDWRSEPG